ncbi:hypothetical protein [Phyllobacterium zundukense]|uniref:Uncharacterized protein n=1 Tax=Phyllobacterium zundukense TaxID=1867719 RepID=A0ACD4D0E6_9HYPH|nr:hypothetical protein [Phyllobacterium zundukense]UXN59259.1 hypothetical protein N8E88_21965 [Phyllobacterium zundukense]
MIKNWDKRIIELFHRFSEREFQRDSWFGLNNEVSSPDEMCNWLDDLDLEGWIKQKSTTLDSIVISLIEDFILDIEKLPKTNGPLGRIFIAVVDEFAIKS